MTRPPVQSGDLHDIDSYTVTKQFIMRGVIRVWPAIEAVVNRYQERPACTYSMNINIVSKAAVWIQRHYNNI